MAGTSEIDTSGRNETSKLLQVRRWIGMGMPPVLTFVRNGGPDAMSAVGLAMRQCGVTETTSITVLTDGDAGLRAIHQQVAPRAEHVLDWFHIGMRFTNLQQLAKGVNAVTDGGVRSHALAELDRAKWRFWNSHIERGLIGLVHLRQWARAQCFDHIPSLKKLENSLLDMIRYLELNADSIPTYGKRYRAGQRISTGLRLGDSSIEPLFFRIRIDSMSGLRATDESI